MVGYLPWRSHSLIVASSSLSSVCFASEVKVDLWQTFWGFPDIRVWFKDHDTKMFRFPYRENCICFQNCLHSLFFLPYKTQNKLFLRILKTQPNCFLLLTVRKEFPSSPALWDVAPVCAASQQHRAGQLLSPRILLPLWKEDSGVKSVVTALTSYRIHGFSIAWRIWTLRRWKSTTGTASKVHVWSTCTGASQTSAWVKHSTYVPNATRFI